MELKYGTWTVSSYEPADARALCAAGFSPITAALLCSRGYRDADAAREFLSCSYPLSSPFDLLDMDKAAARVRLALQRREHIAVFGDYDVDGITATCLLTEYLRSRGGHVTSYIPARLEEGYGLNPLAIDTLKKQGVELIVTVDCGITANQEAQLCKELGIDLVITDHHECKSELPQAAALVDPHRKDQPQPVTEMAGVGVAFKLAAAIEGDQEKLLDQYCDFLCLGTVADVMPLTGENRTMVARGLRALANPKRVGIAALMAECAVQKGPVTAGTIGYTLAPRINAAGRMGKADLAAELFLTQDMDRAIRLAVELCEQNKLRQTTENEILNQALTQLRGEYDPAGDKMIVLAGKGWHQGVIGIVCSRLCDRYGCPVVLISIDSDGIGKGSGRSIGSFNLFDALTSCSDLLDRYGGHALAAGLTIDESNIDALKARLKAYAETHVTRQQLIPQLHIDCMVEKEWLTIENIEGLSMLEPYGMQNAEPVFCMKDLIVEDITPLSSDRHVRLSLSKDGTRFNAIWFGTGAGGLGFVPGSTVDAAFHLEINEYHNRRSVQLVICDVQLSECEHRADQLILNLYNILMQDGPLTALEARRLLPERKDLVAVWRHIVCRAEDGRLSVPDGALSRRVSWESRREINIGKLLVSLDVFSESGLISYHFKEGMINVCLKPYEGKADISGSVVLRTLQSMAG